MEANLLCFCWGAELAASRLVVVPFSFVNLHKTQKKHCQRVIAFINKTMGIITFLVEA